MGDTEASTVDTTDTPWSTPSLARLWPPSPTTPTPPTAITTERGPLMLSRRLRLMLMPRLTPGWPTDMVLATDTAMAMDTDTADTAGPTDTEATVLTATATDL